MTIRLAAGDHVTSGQRSARRGGDVRGVRFDDLDRTQRADLSRFVFAQARLRQAGADTTDESAA